MGFNSMIYATCEYNNTKIFGRVSSDDGGRGLNVASQGMLTISSNQ